MHTCESQIERLNTKKRGDRLFFKNIKESLSSITALPYLNSKANNFQLVTDSSNYAVGAALLQMVDGQPIPIDFFSKKLSLTQQNILIRTCNEVDRAVACSSIREVVFFYVRFTSVRSETMSASLPIMHNIFRLVTEPRSSSNDFDRIANATGRLTDR